MVGCCPGSAQELEYRDYIGKIENGMEAAIHYLGLRVEGLGFGG